MVICMLATKPKIVSLNINKIIAEKAPIVVKKVPMFFPVNKDKIITIPTNQIIIKNT